MSSATLFVSGTGLLSGGLYDCPTPTAEKCNGGVTSIAALMRHSENLSEGGPALYVPATERDSPFVQMHPLGLGVNRKILNERFGLSIMYSTTTLFTEEKDLSYLRSHELPILLTNSMIPPSNIWRNFVKIVHFDNNTGFAVIVLTRQDMPLSTPVTSSTVGALNYISETNAGIGCDKSTERNDNNIFNTSSTSENIRCWVPVIIFTEFEPIIFKELVKVVTSHQSPPAIVIDTRKNDIDGDYNAPKVIGRTWIWSFENSSKKCCKIRVTQEDPNDSSHHFINIAVDEIDLNNLPSSIKDEKFISDQIYLRSLAEEAIVNDPIIGKSSSMPSHRHGNFRLCMGGECPLGNLFTDAMRWKVDADFAVENSGGFRGSGWSEGNVYISNLWQALPFQNVLCTGIMNGISVFKLLNHSTALATYDSTYTPHGDRLLQCSGLRYKYNTELDGKDGRLIAVDVWDKTQKKYMPLERLKLYKFVTSSWMCTGFDKFPFLLGDGLTMEGEIPGVVGDLLLHDAVASYLLQLNEMYNTNQQGRLQNDTEAHKPLNMIQSEDGCPAGTFWEEQIATCSNCPQLKYISFSDEIINMEAKKGEVTEGRVILFNREMFNVTFVHKYSPNWITFKDETHIFSNNPLSLSSGESLPIGFVASTDNLQAGTTRSTISFGILLKENYPGCLYDHDVTFDASLAIIPESQLNQIVSIRPVGLTLMAIAAASSIFFIIWTYFNRTKSIIKASQPSFLIVICAGTFIMATVIIPLSIDDSIATVKGCSRACMAVPWLASTGFAVTFSALFGKIWRINKLVKLAQNFEHVEVKEKDMLIPFAVVFALNFILLLSWTLVDPLKWHRIPIDNGESTGDWNTYGICLSEERTYLGFLIPISIMDVTFLILACVEAYNARNISDELSESKYVGIAMFSWLQVILVGGPILLLVQENPSVRYLLASSLLFVLCMSMLMLIFIPKIMFKGDVTTSRILKVEDRSRVTEHVGL